MKSIATLLQAALPLISAAPCVRRDNTTATDTQYRWLGRINPAPRQLTWPGTSVFFRFNGRSASITLTNVIGSNSFDLIVDGGVPTVIANASVGAISTPSNLDADAHTVYLEDNPMTYEALAADSLGTDYNVIAWSGKGLVHNAGFSNATDTSPLMPEYWTHYGADDAENSYPFPASWSPEAVVINLGTNDWSGTFAINGTVVNARPPINATAFCQAMVPFAANITAKTSTRISSL